MRRLIKAGNIQAMKGILGLVKLVAGEKSVSTKKRAVLRISLIGDNMEIQKNGIAKLSISEKQNLKERILALLEEL